MRPQDPSPRSMMTGCAVILILESALTVILRHSPAATGNEPGLVYLYLLIITLAAMVWGLPHALFAVLLALTAQDLWIFPPFGHLTVTLEYNVRLVVFAIVAVLLCLAQHRVMQTRRRLQQECETYGAVTRTLNRALLPQLREIPGYDSAFLCETASGHSGYAGVGGAFVDLFHIRGDCLGLLVGDVMGNGLPVAVQSVQLRYMLETCALQGQKPSACLDGVNRVVCSDNRFTEPASIFCAMLDTRRHTLIYSGAGHEPALLWRHRTGAIERLESAGAAVGSVPGGLAGFRDGAVHLEPGDALLIYTDGVIQARQAMAAGEFFGRGRLEAALWCLSGDTAASAVRRLYSTIRDFTRKDLKDNMAVLWIRRPLPHEVWTSDEGYVPFRGMTPAPVLAGPPELF